jgi:prolyl oligopeptidase PreP (S9A serine peptidase family)
LALDRDTVYAFTDFGEGSMTESGYPRIVKRWRRGTPLVRAETVYEGRADDMYIAGYRDLTPGFERDFVSRTLAFYNDELYLAGDDGNQYYYAHLHEILPEYVPGRRVVAGELIALNGATGNADFDAPHVHLEVHPGGGAAVNPYPYAAAACF